MIEIRIHGRGGQGAVLASTLLAEAAFRRAYQVQVFPEFGVERRGVPVTAFARLDRRPIRLRTKILRPHHVLVLDAALAQYLPVCDGLQTGGWLVMNAPGPGALDGVGEGYRRAWVDGSAIAAKHRIGTATAPIVNTTMVGALARATGLVGPDEIRAAMQEAFGEKAERNVAAALEAYETLHFLDGAAAETAGVGAEGARNGTT